MLRSWGYVLAVVMSKSMVIASGSNFAMSTTLPVVSPQGNPTGMVVCTQGQPPVLYNPATWPIGQVVQRTLVLPMPQTTPHVFSAAHVMSRAAAQVARQPVASPSVEFEAPLIEILPTDANDSDVHAPAELPEYMRGDAVFTRRVDLDFSAMKQNGLYWSKVVRAGAGGVQEVGHFVFRKKGYSRDVFVQMLQRQRLELLQTGSVWDDTKLHFSGEHISWLLRHGYISGLRWVEVRKRR